MHKLRGIFLALILISSIVLSAVNTEAASIEDDSASPMDAGGAMTIPPKYIQDAIANIVDEVSPINLKTYLTKLQNFGSRLYRAPGMFNASIWLHDVLKGNGRIEAEYHNFTVVRPTWGTFVLNNVILTLPGLNTSSDQIYYMFAHSDAVQMTDSNQWLTNTPGADDDGSGCASILEAARILSRYDFQDTIKFAFFNAEEIGLVGSDKYADNMSKRGENVVGSIDYDMIGYSPGTALYDLDLAYNSASSTQGVYTVGVNDRYDIGLSINAYQTSGWIPSDISSFYSYGFPGVFGIEHTFSPYYHSTNDLVKFINFTLIDRCTRLAVASLAEMARLLYVDLTIPSNSIIISEPTPMAEENVTLSLNITNTGNLDANDCEVVFYSDGMVLASDRINIQANSTNISTAYWNASKGLHNLSVVIDPINEIVEINEANNSAWVHITGNDYPQAVITAAPLSVLTNETVIFNGSFSRDQIGGVSEYNFSFGDGNSTGWNSSETTSHFYSDDGVYTTRLKVRDVHGIESAGVNLTITVLNRAPVASPWSNLTRTFSFTPIQFRANSNDPDGTVSSLWDFGDGNVSTMDNPIHSYSNNGIYDVDLIIQDDDGANGSYELKIMIDNRPPICAIGFNTLNGNITTEFDLTADATDQDGYIANYAWDFGDGGSAITQAVSHKFTKPGQYKIYLSVLDDDGSRAEAVLSIRVSDLPPVAIGNVSALETYTSKPIYFNGESSFDLEGPITYHWNFGDGNSSSVSKPSHTYSRPGSYNATLTVTDALGQMDAVQLTTVQIINRPPVAMFRTFGNFTINGTILFDGTGSTDPEGKLQYLWLFGDGFSANDSIVDHAFVNPGNYTVSLSVTDLHGAFDTADQVITIRASAITEPDPVENNSKPLPSNNDTPIVPDNANKESKETENNSWFFIALVAINIIWIIILISMMLWLKPRRKNEPPDRPELVSAPVQPATVATPSSPAASAVPAENASEITQAQPSPSPPPAQPQMTTAPSLPLLPEPKQILGSPTAEGEPKQELLVLPTTLENQSTVVNSVNPPIAQPAPMAMATSAPTNSPPTQNIIEE